MYEASVVASLLKQCIEEKFGMRIAVLLDSAVAKGAISKGRSSSFALQPVLKRAAACQLAGNPFPSFSFAPTKLNDPTRDVDLREPFRYGSL